MPRKGPMEGRFLGWGGAGTDLLACALGGSLQAGALTLPVQWALTILAGGDGRLRTTHGQGSQQYHDKHALGLPR